MPIIAPQHKWKDSHFKPLLAWPDDTKVQWGSTGVVFTRGMAKPSYTTAFFEAFPNPEDGTGHFIRGEGSTLEKAEANAFAKYSKQGGCQHLWGRENYDNGGQFCRRCRAFRSGVLQPIAKLGIWHTPLKPSQAMILEMSMEMDDTWKMPGSRSICRRLYLRQKFFGEEPR